MRRRDNLSHIVSGNDSESDGDSSSSSGRISISSSTCHRKIVTGDFVIVHVLKTGERREAAIDPREGGVL